MQEDVPEATVRDIYDAFGGRRKSEKSAQTEQQKLLTELKKQARKQLPSHRKTRLRQGLSVAKPRTSQSKPLRLEQSAAPHAQHMLLGEPKLGNHDHNAISEQSQRKA